MCTLIVVAVAGLCHAVEGRLFFWQDASTMEERQKIFYLLGELHVEGASLYAELLGFDPIVVVPKFLEDVANASKN